MSLGFQHDQSVSQTEDGRQFVVLSSCLLAFPLGRGTLQLAMEFAGRRCGEEPWG